MLDNSSYSRNIRRTIRVLVPALAALALTLPAMAGAPATRLVFAGSGTNLPIIRLLAKAFQRSHPEIDIQVPASIGSTSGIRAVADGAIAIGLISRPLKESEKALGLEVVTYCRTPLIIGVHPTVAEDNITFGEIIDIYKGKKRSWKDNREIIVLTREPGDSTIEVMNSGVPGFMEVYEESQKAKRWTTLLKDLEMDQTLAKTPGAIGFTDLGSLTIEQHRIKPLRVNGVAPTIKNSREGKYPLTKPLMLVYQKGKIPTEARKFVSFVRSKQGTKIMGANGYLAEK